MTRTSPSPAADRSAADRSAADRSAGDRPAVHRRTVTIDVSGLRVDRGGEVVLTIDQLSIPTGYTALVGPNGSGKSTLLHIIAGLLEPAAGTVHIGGHPAAAGDRRIAYVLQAQHASDHLLVTAREVVALGRARGALRRLDASDKAAVALAMERLHITDLANRHLAEMSGGQRQRVFIAQGLAQQSDVLLLDEPVAGLDIASAQTIRQAIDDERQAGRSVLVATHDLDEAGRADHVALLSGRIVAFGTPSMVLQAANLRTAYQGRVLEIGDGLVVDDGIHHDHPH